MLLGEGDGPELRVRADDHTDEDSTAIGDQRLDEDLAQQLVERARAEGVDPVGLDGLLAG
jgi:hypothetical protein